MRTTERQCREGEPTIDDMRYDLAEAEAMNMNVSQIINMLLDGVQGLNEIPNIEIKDEWNQMFGESE
jgi:antitoxin component of RelBE/YafQ-DinJ toxin-antitoxin module